MSRRVVLDASALVELLVGGAAADWVMGELDGSDLHAPAHLHAEVLSAVGRRERAGLISAVAAEAAVRRSLALHVTETGLAVVVPGAWMRRGDLRLTDALYVELAAQLATVVVTTDRRLARATPLAVAPPS